MLHHIKDNYRNPNLSKINTSLMNREYERDLVYYVVDCFKSITGVLNEIRLVNWEFLIDVDKVDQSQYEISRNTSEPQKYVSIKETRVGELILEFEVHLDDGDILPIKRKLLVPLADDDGSFLINGKRYVTQYQLVESSTYTTSSNLILKSLMPIKLRKGIVEIEDIEGNQYTFNKFEVFTVYSAFHNILQFYFATMGWDNTLEFFDVGKLIELVTIEDNDPRYTYFKISNGVTIKVLTVSLQNQYVQSIVGSICALITRKMSIADIRDKDYWICRIGALKSNSKKDTHYELGTRFLILFNRLLDETIKGVLRLEEYNKRDVYHIIRWMVQNYDELRRKDNLDIINKRLRCNECVASLLNNTISAKIKSFVNTAAATKEKLIDKYHKFFSIRGNEIISKLHSSGLMRCDDVINDDDMFQKLKITTKGPNSLGNSNSRNISSVYRALHPSHVGRLDLNFCSASSPGLTNYITPLCKTDGMYFQGAPAEPESFAYNFKAELDFFTNGEGVKEPKADGEEAFVILDPVKYQRVLDVASRVRTYPMVREDYNGSQIYK